MNTENNKIASDNNVTTGLVNANATFTYKKEIYKSPEKYRTKIISVMVAGFIKRKFPETFEAGIEARRSIEKLDGEWNVQVMPEILNKLKLLEEEMQILKEQNLLDDSLDSSIESIGKTLLNQENFANELVQKLISIDSENFIESRRDILIPILKLINTNTDDDIIRNLYTNLLAATMDKTMFERTRPSFVQSILELSPIDVEVFKELSVMGNGVLADIWLIIDEKNNGQVMYHNVPLQKIDYERGAITASIDNLLKLRFIEIPENHGIFTEFDYSKDYKKLDEYVKLEKYIDQQNANADVNNDFKKFIRLKLKTYEVTNLGSDFKRVCMPNVIGH
ncbi:Abi-alpha family protein [Secundilactobacillus similis]|uniref:DUF4393 domain-containing protein n=1 Tax=Secundilactobacillus similis DSM 23365 = JCM 2765 TaxID=1423804 RepID=A0A0R2FNU8_9LACO|nr:Abi-alpha family protein [Secundilactobacillus similis]KRN26221.1 hypothetical protein FD14_GL002564 [Secundilactobacillus similis DSM 23365 = JCM 2765]